MHDSFLPVHYFSFKPCDTLRHLPERRWRFDMVIVRRGLLGPQESTSQPRYSQDPFSLSLISTIDSMATPVLSTMT